MDERLMGRREKDEELLKTLRVRLDGAIRTFASTRESELDDLKFYAGSPDNKWQWPADVMSSRNNAQGQLITARPCLTLNRLPQHVKQVTNDQRQNRPSGKVIPADDNADIEVAEIFSGMCRHIETSSDIDIVLDTASENQVIFGEGYFRILTEYVDDTSFDQEIRYGRIRNSFSVYMDPMSQDPCGADANWCILTEEITKEDYQQRWPDSTPITSLKDLGAGDMFLHQWLMEDVIRIAEYFYIDYTPSALNLYPGNVIAADGTQQDKELRAFFGKPARSRPVAGKRVLWLKTNGYDILESGEWAGQYIPVIRVVGNEFEIDGEVFVSGLVRNAKDAQRMYNYWASQEAEMLALAPKAPFIGYAGQFRGFEHQWKTANTQNWPYLEVNPDVTDGQGGILPLPERSMPPMAQTGLIQAKMGAAEDIKAVTGQYNAALGMTSNERSGKAILARQKEGDVGTYHYMDNLARAVRHATRQIIDLIPKVYDTERIVRIVGEDGKPGMARINPSQGVPVNKIVDSNGSVVDRIYNPGVGKYDVVVVTGPGYSTKRQEAMESMAQLLMGNPSLWQVAGDIFVRNMDWPGAQELAKRFAKTIDPKLTSEGDDNPALQAAQQQMQAMAQEMEQMHGMLKNVQNSMDAREVAIKEFEAQIKAYQAETQRISATQAGMSPEQIQDIVMGTVDAAVATGDLSSGSLQRN